MKKLLILILCSLLVTGCKDCEEVNPTSKHNKLLSAIEFYAKDSLSEVWNLEYNKNNKLINIKDIKGRNKVTINEINDTTVELIYNWYDEAGNKSTGNLRADYKNNYLTRLYKFNKVTNEIKSIEYELTYDTNYNLISIYRPASTYFISNIYHHDFLFDNDNSILQYTTNFTYSPPFGIPSNESIVCNTTYTTYPYSKYIPFQYEFGYEYIYFGYWGDLINPFYILGINDIQSVPKSKYLAASYEHLNGDIDTYTFNLNYELVNDTVQRMLINEYGYDKLIWE